MNVNQKICELRWKDSIKQLQKMIEELNKEVEKLKILLDETENDSPDCEEGF